VWLGSVNILIAGFNLLPAAPLDGGRILHAWLWHRRHDRDRAGATAALVGRVLGQVLFLVGLAELLLWSLSAGLWLAVLGFFLTSAASAERASALVGSRLKGLTVADVMTTSVQVAPGWWTVEAFLDHLAGEERRHRVFPVQDFDGRPVGVVRFADLAAVSAEQRVRRRVSEVGRPLDTRTLAPVYEPLSARLRRTTPRPGRDLIVVVRDHKAVGVITAADLAWALDLARLGKRPVRQPEHADGAHRS
jgi:CBS domain-containing protein